MEKSIKKTININKVIPDAQLEVAITGMKVWKIKLFIGINLIKFAAWLIGCQIKIEY